VQRRTTGRFEDDDVALAQRDTGRSPCRPENIGHALKYPLVLLDQAMLVDRILETQFQFRYIG
jgi:hypothetical protein